MLPVDLIAHRLERLISLLEEMKEEAFNKSDIQEYQDLTSAITYLSTAYDLLVTNKNIKSRLITELLIDDYPDVFDNE